MAERSSENSTNLILPACGAFIVLATFVVREGFRDHYKDLAASVDSARIAYLQRTQVGDLQTSLEGVRRIIERQSTPGLETYDTFYQKWIDYDGQIKRLQDLLAKLNGTSADTLALEEIIALHAKFHVAVQNYGQLIQSSPNANADELSRESGVIWIKANSLEKGLIDAASTEAEHSERYSTGFTYASYVLYALGWALGFMGKMLKLPGVDGSE